MKKSYQKRLDSLIGEDLKEQVPEEVPEIEDLDSILSLPKPLREMSFVKAACKAYKKSRSNQKSTANKKSKNTNSAKSEGIEASLEQWQGDTADKSQNYNRN